MLLRCLLMLGLLVCDVAALVLSLHAASVVGALPGTGVGHPGLSQSAFVGLWLLALAWMGLYTDERRSNFAWSLVQSTKACFSATAAWGLALVLTEQPAASWRLLACLLPTTTVAVGSVRLLSVAVARALLRRGYGRQRVAVVAWDDHSRRIAKRLQRHPSVEFVGYFAADDLAESEFSAFYPMLGSLDDLAKEIDRHSLERVVCQDRSGGVRLRELVNLCGEHGVSLDLVPDALGFIPRRIERRELAGMPLFTLRGDRRTRGERFLVRAFDLVVGGALLLLSLPFMLVIAAAIKLDSLGPVIYRQRRLGQGGHPFEVLKFRSMQADAEHRHAELLAQNECGGGVLFKMRRDPRLTRVGALIRRGTLDELPQIVQVVSGSLSIVGPRPLAISDLENLDESRYWRWRLRRHLAKPGLAGSWQANGRSELDFDDLVDFDLYQLEGWSFTSDLVLILETAGAVFSGRGAY